MPQEDWLTVAEAAEEWRVTDDTIRRYVDRGLLPAVKLGDGRSGPLRIRRADFDAMPTPVKRTA